VYLRNDRCIILAVIPANVDFHNSQILQMALKVDPETRRTIPVITKADLVDVGGEKPVLDLLHGLKIKSERGFHMVKCRSQQQVNDNVTLEASLAEEARFFRKTSPWKDEARMNQFGVRNLLVSLGGVQEAMIHDELPKITAEVHAKRVAVEAKISLLGMDLPDASTRRMYINGAVTELTREIDQTVEGSNKTPLGVMTWCARVEQRLSAFSDAVLASPLDCPLPTGTEVRIWHRHALAAATVTGSTRDAENKVGYTVRVLDCENGDEAVQTLPLEKIVVDNSDLLELIRNNATADVRCFQSARIFNTIVERRIADDITPLVESAYADVNDMLESLVGTVVVKACGTRFRAWARLVGDRVTTIIQERRALGRSVLEKHLEHEKTPHTFNDYLAETMAKLRNSHLKDQVMAQLNSCDDANVNKTAVAALFGQNGSMSLTAHMARDLQIALFAYGKVAAKRINDSVTQAIRVELLHGLGDAVRTVLTALNDDQIASALDEGTGAADRRAMCDHELKVLATAEQRLSSVSFS
jgi:hypothetical protein